MNAVAQAWHRLSRVSPTNVNEMQAAMRLASKLGIDYCDALAKVREEAEAITRSNNERNS